jgi:uncharacterized UPF0146 family protein
VVEYITGKYDDAVEIGIGHFPDVALALKGKGVKVLATDIKQFQYGGLKVVVDDVTEPDLSLYNRVHVIYALRPPMELVPYMVRLAKAISTDLIVKPLASEYPGGQLTGSGNSAFYLWSRL